MPEGGASRDNRMQWENAGGGIAAFRVLHSLTYVLLLHMPFYSGGLGAEPQAAIHPDTDAITPRPIPLSMPAAA